MAKLLDRDPLTGATQWYQFDKKERESEDQHTITTVTDIEPILRAAQDARNQDSYSGRKFNGLEMRHAMYITPELNARLAARDITYPGGGIKDEAAFKRWFNNSDEAEKYKTIRGLKV